MQALLTGQVAANYAYPPFEYQEVEAGGHDREATLGYLRRELVDLAAVEQELAVAVRVVRLDRRLLERRDVEADEPELAVAWVGIGALEDRVAAAQRLDLAARECEPRLDALEEVVFVPRTAVLRDQLLAVAPVPGHAHQSRL